MTKPSSVPASSVTVDLGHGAQEVVAGEWSSSRTLSGGGLPGQARAATGSSVGSGSLTIYDQAGATPWSGNAPRPGGALALDVADDAEGMADGGSWWREVARSRVRSIGAPSLLSGERTLDFEDDIPRGDVTIPTMLAAGSLDACAVVDLAARQGGYYATRAPSSTTILSLPLVGSLRNEVGPDATSSISDGARYGHTLDRDASAMLTDSLIVARIHDDLSPGPLLHYVIGMDVHVSHSGVMDPPAEIQVYIDSESGEILNVQVYEDRFEVVNADTTFTLSFPTTSFSSSPRRIELLHLGTRWDIYLDGLYQGNIDVDPLAAIASLRIAATSYGLIGAVTVDENGTSIMPAHTPSASIWPADSPLEAVIGASGDSWALIQQVAASTLGAAWIDERGRLNFRGRDAMRGATVSDESHVDVLDTMEDLPWRVSTDDVADRIEVTYSPPVVSRVFDGSLTIWETTDPIRVGPSASVTIVRDIEGAASSPAWWERAEDVGTYPIGQMSRYWAWTAPPGEAGSAPAASALVVSTEMVSPSRIRIQVRNVTGSPIWLYQMIARADTHAIPGEPVTLATGLSPALALNPYTLNTGSWVQDPTAAAEILSWLSSTLTSPLPVIGPVRVAPDADRLLGDTIVADLRSDALGPDGEPIEALRIKALVSGISQSHAPGEFSQSYTLTALHAIENDLAQYIGWELSDPGEESEWAAHLTALGLTTEADLAAFINKGGILA